MPEPLERLLSEGLVCFEGGRTRTTARWQAAMARAAAGLQRRGAPWRDLRLPIISALIDRFPEATDEEVVDLAEAMVAIEEQELAPIWGGVPR